MAKYTIDAVLEVWGSFDVEADSFGEAYRKAAENPGKYANLKVWNDGAEAQLRTYSHINCVGEYDIWKIWQSSSRPLQRPLKKPHRSSAIAKSRCKKIRLP